MPNHELLSKWDDVARWASNVDDAVRGGPAIDGLRASAKLHEALGDFIVAMVEQAAREGVTQKTIALTLDIPVSSLTGLRRTVGAV